MNEDSAETSKHKPPVHDTKATVYAGIIVVSYLAVRWAVTHHIFPITPIEVVGAIVIGLAISIIRNWRRGREKTRH